MEYYLTLKGKEILPQATAWMSLEDIMLIEISQSQKARSGGGWGGKERAGENGEGQVGKGPAKAQT